MPGPYDLVVAQEATLRGISEGPLEGTHNLFPLYNPYHTLYSPYIPNKAPKEAAKNP